MRKTDRKQACVLELHHLSATWAAWPNQVTVSENQRIFPGASLVVQWLRLHAPNAGGPRSIPGQGTRCHMPQLRPRADKWIKQTNGHFLKKNISSPFCSSQHSRVRPSTITLKLYLFHIPHGHLTSRTGVSQILEPHPAAVWSVNAVWSKAPLPLRPSKAVCVLQQQNWLLQQTPCCCKRSDIYYPALQESVCRPLV